MRLILLMMMMSMSMASAEASFFRFWRGSVKPGMEYTDFQQGLNTLFVPATAALKHTPAELKSYHPFLFSPESMALGFPSEIALVEYDTEDKYLAFRATEEGKKYGDMHWDYFDKANSKSLVPVPYINQPLEFEKAYAVFNSSSQTFSERSIFLKVIKRTSLTPDQEWKDQVAKHIQYLNQQRVVSQVVLLTSDYYMEYTKWESLEDKYQSDSNTIITIVDPVYGPVDLIQDSLIEAQEVIIDSYLKPGSLLQPDAGLSFQ